MSSKTNNYTYRKSTCLLTVLICSIFLYPHPAQSDQTEHGLSNHFSINLSYSAELYENMNETYTFNPVLESLPEEQKPSVDEWTRRWEQQQWIIRPSYSFNTHKYVSLALGLNAGITRGQFNAETSDENSFTSETWTMNHSFTWGPHAEVILTRDQSQGPFLSFKYNMLQASGDEDRETLFSDKNTNTEERHAHFRWRTEHYETALGWRTKILTPALGIRFTDFKLSKWLSHDIDESIATNPFHKNVIELLNSEPSSYHYRNEDKISPFVSLKWKPHSRKIIEIFASLDDTEQYMASIAIEF